MRYGLRVSRAGRGGKRVDGDSGQINPKSCKLAPNSHQNNISLSVAQPRVRRVLLLNGPNLNLLGSREPQHYGSDTLSDIESRLARRARQAGVDFSAFQSNSEAELVERIQSARHEDVDFIIINPAAYTHTSVAMRDALSATAIPFVEVHLTNIHGRESFRQRSYFSDLALGTICGLGARGYELALAYALQSGRKR
jgi:3-dehydroquinate dehydratase-2